MYWITDRTPHESLPLTNGYMRQFFRLVVSSPETKYTWLQDHSTQNELVTFTPEDNVEIARGNKFEDAGILLIDE